MIKDYRSGLISRNIAIKYNITQSTIYKILKLNKIKTNRKKINTCDKKNIIKLYLNGRKIQQIAKKFKVDKTRIWQILKENKIKLRPLSLEHRKYTINDTIFEKINTPKKAQLLGLIYADGCNYFNARKNKYDFIITLAKKDLNYLKQIKKLLETNKYLKKIINRKGFN